jgi:DNA-binding GntR family transcriptional regulator
MMPNSPKDRAPIVTFWPRSAAVTLPPGARLRETDLADRLGISRTPVREAIRQLEADGLVIHLPRQGATVRSLDYAEVIELYEMRAVLEGTAARLAARAASSVELAELAALHADLAAAPAGAQARELNRQFHRTLLDAAKNRFLLKAMAALQKTMLILGPTTLADPARAADAVAEHAGSGGIAKPRRPCGRTGDADPCRGGAVGAHPGHAQPGNPAGG